MQLSLFFRNNNRCRQHIHDMTQGWGCRKFHQGYHRPLAAFKCNGKNKHHQCGVWRVIGGIAVSPSGTGWALSEWCGGQLLPLCLPVLWPTWYQGSFSRPRLTSVQRPSEEICRREEYTSLSFTPQIRDMLALLCSFLWILVYAQAESW